MAKKNTQSGDKMAQDVSDQQESEAMATTETIETVETTAATTEAQKPVELVDFDKAFRIFKRDNPKSKTWDQEAVLIFVKKKIAAKLAPLDDWLVAISKY